MIDKHPIMEEIPESRPPGLFISRISQSVVPLHRSTTELRTEDHRVSFSGFGQGISTDPPEPVNAIFLKKRSIPVPLRQTIVVSPAGTLRQTHISQFLDFLVCQQQSSRTATGWLSIQLLLAVRASPQK